MFLCLSENSVKVREGLLKYVYINLISINDAVRVLNLKITTNNTQNDIVWVGKLIL